MDRFETDSNPQSYSTMTPTKESNNQEKTGLGNYFVANYPPFSFWNKGELNGVENLCLQTAPPDRPLGLYLHIPFCRKRCKFCYFRVYTDKNARDIEFYLDSLVREIEILSTYPYLAKRPLKFVYFGGGTPSFLSVNQIRGLVDRLKPLFPWDSAEEITFECEPGTLQQHKLEALRDMGITRLSLGIENFSDEILLSNGRAHLSEEIAKAYGWARDLGFPQINIDLIAGMVGETDDNWQLCIEKALAMAPDSLTVYQMELPYNTVYSKELRLVGQDQPDTVGIADWPTKRRWMAECFDRFEKAGYTVTSATTVVKDPKTTQFVYRDALWQGADMMGTGVASFGHLGGFHVQNLDAWETYTQAISHNQAPWARAYSLSDREKFVRESILLLKKGRLLGKDFQARHGKIPAREFAPIFQEWERRGFAKLDGDDVVLTREGLIQIDRWLPEMFLPEHKNYTRYT